MKYLRVSFSNGEMYDIPAELIARNRAEYYVGKDIEHGDVLEQDRESETEAEIKYTLEDTFELAAWAFNNMDWEDVKDVAQKVEEQDKINYEKEWSNVNHKVIEK